MAYDALQKQDETVLRIVREFLEKIHKEQLSGKAVLEMDSYNGNITNKSCTLRWCVK